MLAIGKNQFLRLRKVFDFCFKNYGNRREKTVPFSSSESTVKVIL